MSKPLLTGHTLNLTKNLSLTLLVITGFNNKKRFNENVVNFFKDIYPDRKISVQTRIVIKPPFQQATLSRTLSLEIVRYFSGLEAKLEHVNLQNIKSFWMN